MSQSLIEFHYPSSFSVSPIITFIRVAGATSSGGVDCGLVTTNEFLGVQVRHGQTFSHETSLKRVVYHLGQTRKIRYKGRMNAALIKESQKTYFYISQGTDIQRSLILAAKVLNHNVIIKYNIYIFQERLVAPSCLFLLPPLISHVDLQVVT